MQPPPLIAQLELILRQLVVEHRGLLAALEAHEAALRSCAVEKIERASRDQDAARQKIAAVESRRRQIAHQLARQHRSLKPMTVALLGDLYPDRKASLVAIRAELAEIAARIQQKSSLIARVAQTVLGHVNATLRLVAVAAGGGAATYT
ncbi:hypothetical protein EON77_05720, partial [bacterium]